METILTQDGKDKYLGGSDTEFGNYLVVNSYARAAVDNDFFGGSINDIFRCPSTTSAITYQLRWSTSGGTSYLGNN